MNRHVPHLPIAPSAAPSPEFCKGAKVCLKNCPGPAGVVKGFQRGRVRVFWRDLNFTGKHKPDSLALAETVPDDNH